MLLELATSHPHRFLHCGKCSKCQDERCHGHAWCYLPPGYLHCFRAFKFDMTQSEQKKVKEWEVDDVDTYWDDSEDCEVPCSDDERYYILKYEKPTLNWLYDSDQNKAVLSRNREWSQINSNTKGLTYTIRHNICKLHKQWRIVCPKLKVPTCTPRFPKGVHDLYS